MIGKLSLLAALMMGVASATAQTKKESLAAAQQTVDRAVEYLKSQQKPDGSWQTGNAPPAITAIALKAIVQHPKYDAQTDFVRKGYEKLLSYQYEDGGIYKDLLANYNTAIAISALAAADEPG